MNTTLTIDSVTETNNGRISVKFTKDGKAQRKVFRNRRMLIIWAKGLAALGSYWANSCSQSLADDVAAGRVVTLIAS